MPWRGWWPGGWGEADRSRGLGRLSGQDLGLAEELMWTVRELESFRLTQLFWPQPPEAG